MLKLCLNPNYKQVLGELSQPVITGFNPRSPCAARCYAQGFLLFMVQFNNHQVCVGKGIQHVFLYDVPNFVIDFMMIKRCHMHTSLTCQGGIAHVANITNAILYIGFNDMVS